MKPTLAQSIMLVVVAVMACVSALEVRADDEHARPLAAFLATVHTNNIETPDGYAAFDTSSVANSGWMTPFPPLDGAVLAMATDGNVLYVGGAFVVARGETVNHVARWDGSGWSGLGSGTNGVVHALALGPDGSLYAGGVFTSAGGVPARFIAKWDGDRWTGLGLGMNSMVQSLAVDAAGELYAGGAFTRADTVVATYIARWDGTQWHSLGKGVNHNVMALAPGDDGTLFAGGGFTIAGDVPALQVARWDGERWHALGNGMNRSVFGRPVWALALSADGTLFAGGNFDVAGVASSPNIAQWDGYRWSPLGAGVNGVVRALAIDAKGILYAGGYFSRAGNVDAQHVARWDGRNWAPLGSGTDNLVGATTVNASGVLHVGGDIGVAGDVSVSFLACWHTAVSESVSQARPENALNGLVLGNANPNPTRGSTRIWFSIPRPAHVQLMLFDVLGRERQTLVDNDEMAGRHEAVFEASGLSSGVFVFRLEVEGTIRTRMMVLL